MHGVLDDWSDTISVGDLKRQLTLDTYANELLQKVGPNPDADMCGRIARLKRQLEQMAQPGDVWWEWVQGTDPLMKTGGLAIVRNGKIAWATMTWVS